MRMRGFLIKRLSIRLLPVIMVFAGATTSSYCQESQIFNDTINYTLDDNFGLFESNEILDIILEFDITTFKKEKPEEEYIDGKITFLDNGKDSLTKAIKLRSRGVRRYELCSVPPIRLNFNTKNGKGANAVKNLKLVTHCNNGKQYDSYILKEYLCYRLYNLITNYSFRVRLLRIQYIDTGTKGDNITKYGFIIEPDDMLGRRLGMSEIEDVVVRPQFVSPGYLDRIALFQYLIGNDDWDLASLHNLKVFGSTENAGSNVIPVPYDFDYSGLVSAHYAFPNPDNNIASVHERIYLGPCRYEESTRLLLEEFLQKKEEFVSMVDSFTLLDSRDRKSTLSYIESFFREYRRDEILSEIKKTCKEK